MSDLFDDVLSAEELAIGLGLSEEIAQEKRDKAKLLQEQEQPLIPDEDAPMWYED